MAHKKCEDCPSQDEKPNIAFDWFRDLSNKQIITSMFALMIFTIGSAFGLGSYVSEQKNESNQVNCLVVAVDSLNNKQDNLLFNVKRIADFLDKKAYIPSHLAQLEDQKPKTVIMCDSRIPKKKRRTQRIASDETAINSKEDLESIITE